MQNSGSGGIGREPRSFSEAANRTPSAITVARSNGAPRLRCVVVVRLLERMLHEQTIQTARRETLVSWSEPPWRGSWRT